MLSLRFYGGHYEIGGTKLLLGTDEGAVFLDFGKSFETEGRFFEEPWNPPFHIASLLSVGALPDLPGLYRTDGAAPPVNGIIISHAHQDHGGCVPFVAPGIPVYVGADTRNLMEIRTETGQSKWSTQDAHVDWRRFRTGDEVTVDGSDIRFRPIHVDHSVPASYGFIVEAAGKRIGYTGDIRMHGRHSQMTADFLAALREKPLDVLICEGTRVNPPGGDPDDVVRELMERVYRERMGEAAPEVVRKDCDREEDVEKELTRVIASSEGLVLVEVSPIDLDRMYTVWRAASAAGRTLVVPAKQAYMLEEGAKRTSIKDLVPTEETVLFMAQRKKDKRSLSAGEPEDAESMAFYKWEKALADKWEGVGSAVLWGLDGRAELRENGRKYVICAPQVVYILPELCYRAQPCKIDFILSKSEPFNEEMVFSFDKLLNWLAFFGCRRYYQIHVSGHASPEDLRRIIEEANPTTLVPVHTKHPEMFQGWHDRLLIPSRTAGEPLVLS
ncbi:MAG: MBL fold metallo-hydrolase [Dehalococcoidia bacterium]|nr:MBL fold metallo-hydrolase [Dehalococcoidia bacterium]